MNKLNILVLAVALVALVNADVIIEINDGELRKQAEQHVDGLIVDINAPWW